VIFDIWEFCEQLSSYFSLHLDWLTITAALYDELHAFPCISRE
jgi:hypothetical protein